MPSGSRIWFPTRAWLPLSGGKERLDGERGQLIANIAQSTGKITETELQILQIDQDMRTEVAKDLAEIRGKTAELVEKKVAAEDQLKRVDIRAPLDGIVHELACIRWEASSLRVR
jgi:HlyD family secretion protein